MKVPKPKKQKDITPKLDVLWSEVVKIRAGYKCEYCGETKSLNSHHIFSKSNRSVRWSLDNGICLCVLHHSLGNFSAHKAGMEFSDWVRGYRGEKWYTELRDRSREIVKHSRESKKAIAEELKAMIKEMENE